jgi:APA family basic amino acid/polyamine antiporter
MCVGAGIFSVGAKVIANEAGPSAIISFLIAGAACALAAMCYAEFSSTIPIAGSAYTYSYSTLGEIVAWIVGWNLILELFMAASVILKYWSEYFFTFVELFGGKIAHTIGSRVLAIEWPILIGAVLFTTMLVIGTKFSTRFATIFVIIKVSVIIFIVVNGFRFFNPANLTPFIPPAQPLDQSSSGVLDQTLISFIFGQAPERFGVFGIFAGAVIVIFAFVGFDTAATVAEETKNPKRNVPLGLFVGVAIVTLLYILTALVTAGMVPHTAFAEFAKTHPDSTPTLATAFQIVGEDWVGALSAFGIFVGLTSVVPVCLLGLSRVVFAMSRDGLMPRWVSVTSKRFSTPYRINIIAGVLAFFVASFTSIELLSDMINIGTLSAFIVVSFSVPILRKLHREKDDDGFKVPFSPVLPIVSGCVCVWLALNLAIETWMAFGIWLVAGLTFYLAYGRRKSILAKRPEHIAKDN